MPAETLKAKLRRKDYLTAVAGNIAGR